MSDGLNDNLRWSDNRSETREGRVSASALDASPDIDNARVSIGCPRVSREPGDCNVVEYDIRSAEELRNACVDAIITHRQANRRGRLRLGVWVGRDFTGPTHPGMWPWDQSGWFVVPMDSDNEVAPMPRFAEMWAAIGRLVNHVKNLDALIDSIADA